MDALLGALKSLGGPVAHVAADLGLSDAPGGLIAAAMDAIGPLDILVANHTHHEGPQTLEDLTAAQIDRHLEGERAWDAALGPGMGRQP